MRLPSVVSLALGCVFALGAWGAEPAAVRFPQAARQEVLRGAPDRRARPCLCQFGVDLRTGIPTFHIGQLLPPDDHGHHSYGGPSRAEHDGQVYTCEAGFIDSTHLRAGADWTAHLLVHFDRLTPTGGVVDFGPEGGGVRLVVRRAARRLVKEDLLRLAQRAAYERLLWHEVMSWYYHAPNRMFSEQQSTFSPEDAPSNLIGTEVGRRAIELVESTGMSFEDGVDAAMIERLAALGAVATSDDTRQNFARVDRHQDGPTTGADWYDSDVLFWDQRYLYKRNVSVLPAVSAWRVPAGAEVGCDRSTRGYVGRVPRLTVRGAPLTDLYEWQFTPEREHFRDASAPDATPEDDPRHPHQPQPELVTNRTLPAAIARVVAEMRVTLGEGFEEP